MLYQGIHSSSQDQPIEEDETFTDSFLKGGLLREGIKLYKGSSKPKTLAQQYEEQEAKKTHGQQEEEKEEDEVPVHSSEFYEQEGKDVLTGGKQITQPLQPISPTIQEERQQIQSNLLRDDQAEMIQVQLEREQAAEQILANVARQDNDILARGEDVRQRIDNQHIAGQGGNPDEEPEDEEELGIAEQLKQCLQWFDLNQLTLLWQLVRSELNRKGKIVDTGNIDDIRDMTDREKEVLLQTVKDYVVPPGCRLYVFVDKEKGIPVLFCEDGNDIIPWNDIREAI